MERRSKHLSERMVGMRLNNRWTAWAGLWSAVALAVAVLPGGGDDPRVSATHGTTRAVPGSAVKAARNAFGRMPLLFQSYQGRDAPAVKFVARGPGYTSFFAPGEVVLALREAGSGGQGPRAGSVVRLQLEGAHPAPVVEGQGPQGTANNYFSGPDPSGWRANVPGFARVRYRSVYPGIDIIFYGNQRRLEYDFVVRPAADPGLIAVKFEGADKVFVDRRGDLVISLGEKQIRQPKPKVYQDVDGRRVSVEANYEVGSNGLVRFALGAYDPARVLVIDPVLSYSSYLGGGMADGALAVAVDREGNAYVGGWTRSLNFPLQSPAQGTYGGEDLGGELFCQSRYGSIGCGDAFLAKINAAGTRVLYATYLGGTSSDAIRAVAVDGQGNAYVAGSTQSVDFPLENSPPQMGGFGTVALKEKGFAARISPTGALEFSALIMAEGAYGIALDSENKAYVTGPANALFSTVHNGTALSGGGGDAYVVKLDPQAGPASFLYATSFGGPEKDFGAAIAVDEQGAAHVTGTAQAGFPVGGGAIQSKYAGKKDAFVAKLRPDGSALEYATYLGGEEADGGKAVALDPKGRVHVAGATKSDDFPAKNALQAAKAKKSKKDGFVATLDSAGKRLLYSTYLGGVDAEVHALALDRAGGVIVAGNAGSGLGTKGAVQADRGGKTDAFLAKLDTSRAGKASLAFSTYLGGSESDSARAVAVAPSGNGAADKIYIAGFTESFTGFPVSASALSPAASGENDAFMAYLTADEVGAVTSGALPVVNRMDPRTGAVSGGRRVVIHGKGLGDATSVLFGKAKARILESSDRRLVVLAPLGSHGPVPVRVATPKGRSAMSATATFFYAQGQWTRVAAPGRFHHTATLLTDGTVLLAGGCSQGGQDGRCKKESKASYLFDPAGRRWRRTGDMAGTGPHTAVRLRDGRVLASRRESAEIYDPRSGKWKPAAPPTIAVERAGVGSGAQQPASAPSSARRPDQESSARFPHTTTLLPNGEVLRVEAASTLVYDPKSNKWSASGGKRAGGHATGTAVLLKNGKVLTLGDDVPAELYDAASGEWLPTGDPQKRRSHHTATLLNDGRVFLAGGRDDSTQPTADAEIYDPDALPDPQKPEIKGAWSPARPMSYVRYGHRAGLLSNGNVLVVGGSTRFGDRVQTAEIYDVATGRWLPAGPMTVARGSAVPEPPVRNAPRTVQGGTSFTATVLQDESLLVAGGSTATMRKGGTQALPSAEIYSTKVAQREGAGADQDPASGRFGSLVWVLLGSLALGAAAAVFAVRLNRGKKSG